MKKISISDLLNILLVVAIIVIVLSPWKASDNSTEKQIVQNAPVDKDKELAMKIDRKDTTKVKIGSSTFIYPMPTTIVGVNVDGKPNYLTIAYLGVINHDPPMIAMGWGRGHHSEKGLLKNKTFSINLPHTGMVKATDYVGSKSGKDVDKTKIFDSFYGELGNAPMIKEAPINHELEVVDTMSYFGGHDLIIIGKIVNTYVNKNVMTGDIPDSRKIDPILFSMHENKYWEMGQFIGKAWKIGEEYVPRE